MTSYSICEGFEWDTIVVVIEGSTQCNEFRFMRCTRNLFCVEYGVSESTMATATATQPENMATSKTFLEKNKVMA